jgi:hypothetical protein
MRNTFSFLLALTLVLFWVIIPQVLLAQPPPDPVPVPIDGGASIFAAAAGAYGLKKLYDRRKKGQSQEPDNQD